MYGKQLTKFLIAFLIIGTLAGCRFWQGKPPEKPPSVKKEELPLKKEKPEAKAKMIKITLYFADKDAEYVVPEIREIPETKAVAETTMIELIKGPRENDHLKTIPRGTQLRSLTIKDGVAYVDFSRELVDNHPGGSAGETMTIYSVVNTLTQIPEIKKVQFLVEGKKIETIAGHYDTSQPFERRDDLIKK